MAGTGNNACTGRRAGHSLCPLESCNEGELCPHAVHMALRMEDGVEANAPNSRGGCRRGMEQREPTIAKDGEPPRREERGAGGWRIVWSLVDETRTRCEGEFK